MPFVVILLIWLVVINLHTTRVERRVEARIKPARRFRPRGTDYLEPGVEDPSVTAIKDEAIREFRRDFRRLP